MILVNKSHVLAYLFGQMLQVETLIPTYRKQMFKSSFKLRLSQVIAIWLYDFNGFSNKKQIFILLKQYNVIFDVFFTFAFAAQGLMNITSL